MIILVVENKYNSVNSFIDKYSSQYPKNAIVRVNNKWSEFDMLKQPPLFSSGWLLVSSGKLSAKVAQRIDRQNTQANTLLISIGSKVQLEELRKEYSDLDYKVVDNSVVSDDVAIKWVQDKLECTTEIAEEVVERANGRVRTLVEGTTNLSALKAITKSDVRKYVKKVNPRNADYVWEYVLGWNDRKFSDVVNVVYDFRYGCRWLIDHTIHKLWQVYKVFNAMELQGMSLSNYIEFVKVTDDKELSKMSNYQIKRIMDRYGEVSIQYIYYMIVRLSSIPTNSLITSNFIDILETI